MSDVAAGGIIERLFVALGFEVDTSKLAEFNAQAAMLRAKAASIGGAMTNLANTGVSMFQGAAGEAAAVATGLGEALVATAGQAGAASHAVAETGAAVAAAGAAASATQAKVVTLEATLGSLTAAAAKVGAVIVGVGAAITGMSLHAAEAMDDIGDFADLNEMTAREVAAWQKTAVENDSSVEAVRASIQGLNTVIGDVEKGFPRAIKLFERVGFTPAQVRSIHSGGDALKAVADLIQGLSTREQLSTLAKLNIDRTMLPLLRKGGADLSRMLAEREAANPATPEDYEMADRQTKLWIRVKGQVTSLTRQIGIALMPQVNRALQGYLDWFGATKKLFSDTFIRYVQALAQAVGRLVDMAIDAAAGIKALVSWLLDFKAIAWAAGIALAAFVAVKIGTWAIAAARAVWALTTALVTFQVSAAAMPLLIGAIIAAAILLYDEFQTWREGGDSFLKDWLGSWEEFWGAFSGKFGLLTGFIDDIRTRWRAMLDTMGADAEFVADIGRTIDATIAGWQEGIVRFVDRMNQMTQGVRDALENVRRGIFGFVDAIWAKAGAFLDMVASGAERIAQTFGATPAMQQALPASGPNFNSAGPSGPLMSLVTGAPTAPLGAAANTTTNTSKATTNYVAAPTTFNIQGVADPGAVADIVQDRIDSRVERAIRNNQSAVVQ